MKGGADSQPQARTFGRAKASRYAARMKRSIALAILGVALTGAAAGPHKVERTSPALEFSYEWPAEAAAIPALDLKLYTDAKTALGQALKDAHADQALTRQQKREFHQHDYGAGWETAGQTAQLLSLEGNFGGFTGGAHPNSYFKALLWDRKLNRQTSVGALFVRGGDLSTLTRQTYCKMLDAERKQRREGETLGGDFDECPKYSDLVIVPTDGNKNGRFDTLDFIASPYIAGPYVEGEYEIEVPVTAKLIVAIKPEYRASFEAQRQ